jgi:hypothetical protein
MRNAAPATGFKPGLVVLALPRQFVDAVMVFISEGSNMRGDQGRTRARHWVFWLALLLVAVWVGALDWSAGPWRAVHADEWTKVTLLYSSDVKGKIEPCG